jgi:hypothetical protein
VLTCANVWQWWSDTAAAGASDQDQHKLGQDQHNVVRLGVDAVTDGLIL